MVVADERFDVIVVGGGAGGAVLAARVAEGGLRVLLLEAGGDPLDPETDSGSDRSLRDDYLVPAFHPFVSEHPGLAHDFWVQHYSDPGRQRRDWKHDEAKGGVLYPRVKALGGCTAHHAMIVVRPNDEDWNAIAETMDDPSWRASAMQHYWERIERCRTRWPIWRWLARLTGWNPTGHGWRGWMQTEIAMPLRLLADDALKRDLKASIGAAADAHPGLADDWETTNFDPNGRPLWNAGASGTKIPPLSTRRHVRSGARERARDAEARHPDRLTVRLNAQVTRVEVQDGRAVAVCYRKGGAEHRAEARHDIVLSGGTFLTPQLLMLSGIGDPSHLTEVGIDVVRALPGVGRNMQDRYEIGVVNRMKAPWKALKGISYGRGDWTFWLWDKFRMGNYKSNGLLFAAKIRSRAELTQPDLYCFALLADFRGYYSGYSDRIKKPDFLTWAILKAYTSNTAGTVRLRSPDPDVQPEIQFRYFDEGSAGAEDDLDAMVAAIRFVRRISDAVDDRIAEEEEPGRHRSSDESLRQYVRDHAWGHHACGTCAMMPEEEGGVVDSRFRVYGVDGLRVVDASVFPRIPGYFLVSSVYMIAEKAADAILQDAQAGRNEKVRATPARTDPAALAAS